MKKNVVLTAALLALMAVGVYAQAGTAGIKYELINDNKEYRVRNNQDVQGDVVIPATYNNLPVTAIASQAFVNCSINSVTIPNSVTSIGNQAFNNSLLTSVIIPDSVITIGNSAFNGCGGLASVTIGKGVTSIGQGAFTNCKSLTSITIPNNVS